MSARGEGILKLMQNKQLHRLGLLQCILILLVQHHMANTLVSFVQYIVVSFLI